MSAEPFPLVRFPLPPERTQPIDDFFTEADLVSAYTRQDAIADGVLVPVGEAQFGDEKVGVCFTANLLAERPFVEECKTLIRQGFALLNAPDPEEDGYWKLRVVVKDKVWVIHDGDGITFLRPEIIEARR